MKNIKLPVIALRGMTVLPDMVIHFDISRKKSIRAVEKAMEANEKVFLTAQLDVEVAEPTLDDVYQTGTVARIKQLIKMPNGIIRVLVEGVLKGHIDKKVTNKEYLEATIAVDETRIEDATEQMNKAMLSGLYELIRQYAAVNPKMSKDIVKQWLSTNNARKLLEKIAIDFPMDVTSRQEILEITSLEDLYTYIGKMLIEEINVSRIKEELSTRVKEKIDKHQKDYILREQLSVLHSELDGEAELETDEFLAATEQLQASDTIKERIKKEIRRFKQLQQGSPEANVERNYIETLLDMPWDKSSQDNTDLQYAKKVLDDEHYGMNKVKERILETLAVRNITHSSEAPIICLVGPPGTGKTSIARSIAKALNKEYVRICLGGVRDEAEIRGHRKTYVGAMPGRIIEGLKQAQVKNPLMLLDEIDKISSDYKGDTASALLEVLDGEQNSHFTDHYIELPTDLSQVLFIATANDLSPISRPLLDRMEVIEIDSYTKTEKIHIATEHLIPKQIEKNGLKKSQLKFTKKAIDKLIDGYTREAGVRQLEREIASICRKAVRQLYETGVLDESKVPVRVTDRSLETLLGKVKYELEPANKKSDVGIVRGLAWTSVGGDTLEIEVNQMPGKDELILTGQMGDVMQESARIALTYVRSIVSKKPYSIEVSFFENNTLHLHIPEGATPKDGPSAGVTMAIAMLSCVTGIPVRADVAMTGEINLRGKVLPIGGLREKLLAAKTAGIKTVLVPVKNKRDVEEIDKEITDGLEIIYVQDVKQAVQHALDNRHSEEKHGH